LQRTEHWFSAMLFRKCGEFLAALPGFCCWSCSLRPLDRWRWPVPPNRQPCTACASPYPHPRPRMRRCLRCHHAMTRSKGPQPESSESSFQADDKCCQNHCCCGATTSEWAQPACSLLSFFRLLIESSRPAQSAILHSSDIFGRDSPRPSSQLTNSCRPENSNPARSYDGLRTNTRRLLAARRSRLSPALR
jgi:hypothetical protein